MLAQLVRQTLSVLIVTAYIGATLLQGAPSLAASAEAHNASMGGMTGHQDDPDDRMPCKGMLPGCVSDLGCIFFVSLPAPDLTIVTRTAWSSVSYDNASRGLRGRTIKPPLGPPIRLA